MKGDLTPNLLLIDDTDRPSLPPESPLPPRLEYRPETSYAGVKILYPSTLRIDNGDIEIFPNLELISIALIKAEVQKNPEQIIQIGTRRITWDEINETLKILMDQGKVKEDDLLLSVGALFQAKEEAPLSELQVSIADAINQARTGASSILNISHTNFQS